jgi:hypothetical protein
MRCLFAITVGLAALAETVLAGEEITVSGNGLRIPHPTATNTYAVTNLGKVIHVPANMVYVPPGLFIFGTGTTTTNINITQN